MSVLEWYAAVKSTIGRLALRLHPHSPNSPASVRSQVSVHHIRLRPLQLRLERMAQRPTPFLTGDLLNHVYGFRGVPLPPDVFRFMYRWEAVACGALLAVSSLPGPQRRRVFAFLGASWAADASGLMRMAFGAVALGAVITGLGVCLEVCDRLRKRQKR